MTFVKFKKTWSDQPDVVEDAEPMCSFTVSQPVGTAVVEIRRVDYQSYRYVTVGNLFGSETFRADDDYAVYALLDAISKGGGTLPSGCEVVK